MIMSGIIAIWTEEGRFWKLSLTGLIIFVVTFMLLLINELADKNK